MALSWPGVRTLWCRACVHMKGMSDRVACTVQTGVSSQQINRKARIYASGGAKPLHFNYKTCTHSQPCSQGSYCQEREARPAGPW